jgi:hypothetical protein
MLIASLHIRKKLLEWADIKSMFKNHTTGCEVQKIMIVESREWWNAQPGGQGSI